MQAESALSLPAPDAVSDAHSRAVEAFIAGQVRDNGGFISFAEFMQHALYAPGLGYYVCGKTKFGPDGDFVTAPEVSSLFGRVVALQIAPTLKELGDADVLEVGAGSGKLAVDVLKKLAELDALPLRYRILEVSPELAARQREMLAQRVPALAERVEWLADWPAAFRGVVLANEVLDALPAERFRRDVDGVSQLGVTMEAGRLVGATRPAPSFLEGDVVAIEDELGSRFPPDYVSETAPAASHWVSDLAAHLDSALVLLFDYGLPQSDYYAPDRNGGWLRCHFRHRAHDNPLILPGIQDITAWVDFSRVAHAGVDAGLTLAGYLPQAQFLLHGGLAEELAAAGPEAALALPREIKLLTLPGEMGEHFKAMGFVTGTDVRAPAVFAMADHSHRL
jgi:SAM-dependent MidA family methyltransferase